MSRALIALMWLCAALPGAAQVTASPMERAYAAPVERVKQALQQAGGSSGGRLPGIDGFVQPDLEQAERYERPYYQYRVDVVPSDAGHTLVRVLAKISAWYSGPSPSQSQYRSLPSNGRLEADLLDRIQDALAGTVEPPTARSSITPAPANRDAAKPTKNATPARPDATPFSRSSDESTLLRQELEKLREQRRVLEEKSKGLTSQVAQLDNELQQQKAVSGLASVKRSGASIMSRASYSGPVLFRSRAEDEFTPMAQRGEWMQILISPNTTGWILAEELSLPKGLVPPQMQEAPSAEGPASDASKQDGSKQSQASSTNASPAPAIETPTAAGGTPAPASLGFSVSHEEINLFSGDWPQLKGKKVLFVFVQPRGLLADMAVDDRKLMYSKTIFAARYKDANSAQTPYEGIVVIFMGGKGGVAAAVVSDIRDWVSGKLAEDAFINRCSLDPPEQFRGWNAPGSGGQ